MLFNSLGFFAFLLVFALAYFACPRVFRYVVVTVGSFFFYAQWEPLYTILLAGIILNDFVVSNAIAVVQSKWKRLLLLSIGLAIDYGALVYFKYVNLLAESIVDLSALFGQSLDLEMAQPMLPIGISFFIFQSTGHVVDVFRRRYAPEKNLIRYASYVTFFPQLVAGPIERSSNLLPQITAAPNPTAKQIRVGWWLVGWGLFKKMCIADRLAPLVVAIYSSPEDFNGSYTLLATVCFSIQIYCDFSGYTDIARGVSKLLGIELRLNFRRPYFAKSVTEFWRRWHISLSTWFRDYLYLPLGGNRVSTARWVVNILIVFAVSGIWHGAAWTFVVWGVLHGLALVVERSWLAVVSTHQGSWVLKFGWNVLGRLWTLGIVLAAWTFFRATSAGEACSIIVGWADLGSIQYGALKKMGLPSFEILTAVACVGILFGCEWIQESRRLSHWTYRRLNFLEPVAGAALLVSLICFGVFESIDFIYFQF